MAIYTLTPAQLKGAGIYNSFEIPAGGGIPSFSNTKSIALDGVDDYVNIGTTSLGITTALSVSVWVKTTRATGTFAQIIGEYKWGVTTQRNWILYLSNTANRIGFLNYNDDGQRPINTVVDVSDANIDDGNWHHVLVTWDNTTNTNSFKIFFDGDIVKQVTPSVTGIRSVSFVPTYIGNGQDANRVFQGNIDEVAVWNSDQSANASAIYNSGVPNDLTSLSPLGWWRCGDGDTAPTLTDNGSGGNDGTMTNFSTFSTDVPTASTFSNTKSIALDGVDDYVDCGLGLGNSEGTITSFSVSMWIKPSVTNGNDLFFNIGSFANSFGEIAFQLLSNNLFVKLDGSAYRVWIPYTNTSAWQHLVFVYDGSNSANTKMYINSTLQSTSTGGVHPSSLNLSGLKTIIGAGYSVSYTYSGLTDEVSYFNTTLSQGDVTTIYNGGVPNDISSLSPISWWRCGDGDTAPTLTDNGSASNDGTMTNFTTFSTDVPT